MSYLQRASKMWSTHCLLFDAAYAGCCSGPRHMHATWGPLLLKAQGDHAATDSGALKPPS